MPSEVTFFNKEEWDASGKKHHGWTKCPKCEGRLKGANRSESKDCPADGCDHVFPAAQKRSGATTATATAKAKESNEETIMKSLKAKEWLSKYGKSETDEEKIKEKATTFFNEITPPQKMSAGEVLEELDKGGENGLRKLLKGRVANEEWHDFKQQLGRSSSAAKFIGDYFRLTKK